MAGLLGQHHRVNIARRLLFVSAQARSEKTMVATGPDQVTPEWPQRWRFLDRDDDLVTSMGLMTAAPRRHFPELASKTMESLREIRNPATDIPLLGVS
jgi:hypothetical protein